jgi:hypothetical protein
MRGSSSSCKNTQGERKRIGKVGQEKGVLMKVVGTKQGIKKRRDLRLSKTRLGPLPELFYYFVWQQELWSYDGSRGSGRLRLALLVGQTNQTPKQTKKKKHGRQPTIWSVVLVCGAAERAPIWELKGLFFGHGFLRYLRVVLDGYG